jgi:hypothetical protein
MNAQEFTTLLLYEPVELIKQFPILSMTKSSIPNGGSPARTLDENVDVNVRALKQLKDNIEKVITHKDGSFTVISSEFGYLRFWR